MRLIRKDYRFRIRMSRGRIELSTYFALSGLELRDDARVAFSSTAGTYIIAAFECCDSPIVPMATTVILYSC